MSHLQYYDYEKVGTALAEDYKCSQAVRIGDRIECAGQGGWDPATGAFWETVEEDIAQAFENVQLALKTAGGEGWNQVFRVTSYHVPLDSEAIQAMVKGLKKWCPEHNPIWTSVGVNRLGEDDGRVMIEVVAHDPR